MLITAHRLIHNRPRYCGTDRSCGNSFARVRAGRTVTLTEGRRPRLRETGEALFISKPREPAHVQTAPASDLLIMQGSRTCGIIVASDGVELSDEPPPVQPVKSNANAGGHVGRRILTDGDGLVHK